MSDESVIRWGVKVLRRGDESPGALITGIEGGTGVVRCRMDCGSE